MEKFDGKQKGENKTADYEWLEEEGKKFICFARTF